ncbi:MAG: hypothetical protein JXQ73_11905 [Phycisphaerae bacterium]|nr:hypothetical protein [Phycisphaerae bacterium]
MSDWEIARATGRCGRCEVELKEGDDYYGVLFEVGEGFERKDFCPGCWEAEALEHFCFWKSRIPVKEKKEKLLVDDGVLINFFERLDQQTEPMRVRFRFVLALLLMRKKLLRYEQTMSDGENEHWQMRLTTTNALHQVLNPKMDDEQIASVSGQLGVILRGETSSGIDDPLGEGSGDGEEDGETEAGDVDVQEQSGE